MNGNQRLLLLALFALAGVCSGAEQLPTASLIEGRGLPVCEAYVADLNKSGMGPHGSQCLGDRTFTNPDLQRLPLQVEQHDVIFDPDDDVPIEKRTAPILLNVIFPFSRRVDERPSRFFPVITDFANPDWTGTADQVAMATQQRESAGGDFLWLPIKYKIAHEDIDNDGISDRIFFYQRCMDRGHDTPIADGRTMTAPIILEPHKEAVDEKRTMQIFRTPIPQDAPKLFRLKDRTATTHRDSSVAEMRTDSTFGLFRFQSKTYYDFTWPAAANGISAMAPTKSGDHKVLVVLSDKKQTKRVCTVSLDAEAAANAKTWAGYRE